MKLRNERWDDARFAETRKAVLAKWPVGATIDIEEAFAFHRNLPDSCKAYKVFEKAREEGRILLQPRHGDTLIEDQIETLQYIEKHGGADILSTEADAYSRQLRYDLAEKGLEESRAAGRSLICGTPLVAHGVKEMRRIVEAVNVPSSARMASSDSRLPREIFLAAGYSYILTGALQNVSYEKDCPIETLIEHYQYEDRLVSVYEANGAPIVKEFPATLTGTLVPPAIALTTSIIDAILAATQGVRQVVLGYGMLGNLVQDVAALRVMAELAREYLDRHGLTHVKVYTAGSHWMGDFPHNESHAYALCSLGTTAAALAGASQVIVKSLHEAFGIPTKEANAAGCRATRETLNMLRGQRMEEGPMLRQEMEILRAEVRAILDRTLDLGDGDIAQGAVKAFAAGVIDVPFSPSRWNAGKLMPVRDRLGAVRMLNWGNVPLPKEIAEYHRKQVEERARFENRPMDYQMVVDDVFSMSRPSVPVSQPAYH